MISFVLVDNLSFHKKLLFKQSAIKLLIILYISANIVSCKADGERILSTDYNGENYFSMNDRVDIIEINGSINIYINHRSNEKHEWNLENVVGEIKNRQTRILNLKSGHLQIYRLEWKFKIYRKMRLKRMG